MIIAWIIPASHSHVKRMATAGFTADIQALDGVSGQRPFQQRPRSDWKGSDGVRVWWKLTNSTEKEWNSDTSEENGRKSWCRRVRHYYWHDTFMLCASCFTDNELCAGSDCGPGKETVVLICCRHLTSFNCFWSLWNCMVLQLIYKLALCCVIGRGLLPCPFYPQMLP